MLKKLRLFAQTCIAYIVVSIVVLIFFVPALILIALLPIRYRRDSKIIFWFLHMGYVGVLRATLLPIHIKGLENVPTEAAIIIANHQSALDIPIVGYICKGHPHVWYVLDYYARKPVLGFFVRRMGVTVVRDSGIKAAQSLITGIKMVTEYHCHTLMFPEGGRFIDGLVHPFLGGFVVIARKTKRPVVPVYLRNIGQILPPGSIMMKKIIPIEVVVGPLYYYQVGETDEQFIARVHEWFKQQQ